MSIAGAIKAQSEARCARALREAGRLWAEARWLSEHDMPAGAAVVEERAREAEQRAEAELRRYPSTADLVLRDDYEARLNDYLERRMARYGPLAELVDPDRFLGKLWMGGSNVRHVQSTVDYGGAS